MTQKTLSWTEVKNMCYTHVASGNQALTEAQAKEMVGSIASYTSYLELRVLKRLEWYFVLESEKFDTHRTEIERVGYKLVTLK